MNIYNMKPAWVQIVEDTKAELGRDLTGDEINKIREQTRNYSNKLADMFYDNMFPTNAK